MEINPNSVETEFQTMSADVFNDLFDETPADSTVNHNDLIGGSKPKIEEKPKNKLEEKKEDKEVQKEEKIVVKSKEEIESDIDEALDEDDIVETQKDDSKSSDVDTSEFFKAQYQGLVERGAWFELSEEELKDFEWNEDNYGKLIELQAQWNAEEKFNELVDATGPYGKTILEHIKNGGNPEDIITLFKEIKEVNNFDITTKEGKLGLLSKYYSEELGWTDERIKRFTDRLIDTDDIDAEVKEVSSKIQESIKTKVEKKKAEQEEYLRIRRESEQKFADNMKNVITNRKDIPNKEKQEVLNSLLVYNQTLPDGRKVNQFTIDFMKLQADPEKYVDLVLFIKNPEKYLEKIEKESESKANKRAWNLIKGNGSLKSSTGTRETEIKKTPKNDLVIDYKTFNR